MSRRTTRLAAIGAAAAVALAVPVAGQATRSHDNDNDYDAPRNESRMFWATDSENRLVSFDARRPQQLQSQRAITGLPAGVALRGIDFRPATGDLYGVGSDSVVYRLNPYTAIAKAEGPPSSTLLRGRFVGVDFNPVVDKIRVTTNANQNIRLNPDGGTMLMADADLNPGDPNIVGSAYINSSFNATKPTATTLYGLDSIDDSISVQNPPNNGTLVTPVSVGIDVANDAGFDIAGANNQGYIATTPTGFRRPALFKVNVLTGATDRLGRIGNDRRTITGLAAWQDLP